MTASRAKAGADQDVATDGLAPASAARAGTQGESRADATAAEPTFVEQGVTAAYEVIDAYFQGGRRAQRNLGRQVGRQLGRTLRGIGASSPEAGDRQQRFVTLASELAANWVGLVALASDALFAVVDDAAESANSPAAPRPASPAAESAVAARSSVHVTVEIASPLLARVSVTLNPGTTCTNLLSHGLRGTRGASQPIPVSWERLDGGHVLLRIRVPADQPAGRYTDVVIDADGDDIVGTLLVDLQ